MKSENEKFERDLSLDTFENYEEKVFGLKYNQGANTDLLKEPPCRRQDYVRQVISLICKHRWDYFITLTFEYEINSELQVGLIFNRFIDRLSAMAFGKKSKKRVKAVVVIERFASGNFHIHCIMEDIVSRILQPEKASKFNIYKSVIKAWKDCDHKTTNPLKSASGGQEWFKEVKNTHKLLEYMLKDVKKGSNPILYESLSIDGRRFQ